MPEGRGPHHAAYDGVVCNTPTSNFTSNKGRGPLGGEPLALWGGRAAHVAGAAASACVRWGVRVTPPPLLTPGVALWHTLHLSHTILLLKLGSVTQ